MSADGAPPQMWLDGMDAVTSDPDRNTWTTSKEWADAIGQVDLDPCSNPRAVIHATKTFSLENGQDGLALARYVGKSTRTFVNCPYGPGMVIKWIRAYRHTNFTYLLRADTSTEWFSEIEPHLGVICIPRGRRMRFDPPPGAKESSAEQNHYLYYKRVEDVTEAIRRMCFCWRPDRSMERIATM